MIFIKEKIYTIPVNDAFNEGMECPICSIRKKLEDDAISYTMGPSYMEDDIRAMTDKSGFCGRHINMMYKSGNRLGMALMLKTHYDKVIKDIEQIKEEPSAKKGLFSKNKTEESPVADYLENLNKDCFVCNRINNVYDRYIDTIFYLWKHDKDFKELFCNSKGFCNIHYERLVKDAKEKLSASESKEFLEVARKLYLENMERVRDDLAWFINKYDYKYKDEPWKNAKDSIPRAIIKATGTIIEED